MKRVILITGATKGIGQGILKNLIGDNENNIVVGTSKSDSGVDEINKFIKSNKVQGGGIKLDITNKEMMSDAVDDIKNIYGTIDILINNAGITEDNLIIKLKNTSWDNVINTNLNSVYYMTKLCVRDMMKKHWGRIINIGSVIGSTGNAGQTSYAAAKAGLVGFTKSLAREVASRNITANIISPGYIKTSMTNKIPDEIRTNIIKQIPIGRMGTVEDIAYAVNFIASNNSSFITGETIHVNGGMHMC